MRCRCSRYQELTACNIYIFSLQFFKDVPNCRILICGGDGTVGWLLEAMGEYTVGVGNCCHLNALKEAQMASICSRIVFDIWDILEH